MKKQQAQKWIVALVQTEKQYRKLQTALITEDAELNVTERGTEATRLTANAVDCVNDLLNATTDLRENLERQQELKKEAKKLKKNAAKPAEFSPPTESDPEAVRQHLMDIYGDLGVEWGADPFTRIAALKDAEHAINNAR